MRGCVLAHNAKGENPDPKTTRKAEKMIDVKIGRMAKSTSHTQRLMLPFDEERTSGGTGLGFVPLKMSNLEGSKLATNYFLSSS